MLPRFHLICSHWACTKLTWKMPRWSLSPMHGKEVKYWYGTQRAQTLSLLHTAGYIRANLTSANCGTCLKKVGQKQLFWTKTHRTLLLCGMCLVVLYCSMFSPTQKFLWSVQCNLISRTARDSYNYIGEHIIIISVGSNLLYLKGDFLYT